MSRRPARANPEDVVDFPRRRRRSAPKVTKADYERAAEFLRSMGAMPSAVEIEPAKVRIETTAGVDLTLTPKAAELPRRSEFDE